MENESSKLPKGLWKEEFRVLPTLFNYISDQVINNLEYQDTNQDQDTKSCNYRKKASPCFMAFLIRKFVSLVNKVPHMLTCPSALSAWSAQVPDCPSAWVLSVPKCLSALSALSDRVHFECTSSALRVTKCLSTLWVPKCLSTLRERSECSKEL